MSKLDLYFCISLYFLPITCTVYSDEVWLCHISVTQSESCIVAVYNIPHRLLLCLSCCIITVLPVPDIYHDKYTRQTVGLLFFYKFHICTPCDMLHAKFFICRLLANTEQWCVVSWLISHVFTVYLFLLCCDVAMTAALVSCHGARQLPRLSANCVNQRFFWTFSLALLYAFGGQYFIFSVNCFSFKCVYIKLRA